MSLNDANEARRAAALLAAAVYCAPCETSAPVDVLNIAKDFDRFIRTGQVPNG